MASFGDTLKQQRELREISLRQIAEATKINIRYLEALEQDRFDALPGGLFNKGFIRAYAAYVGLDSEAMVNSYLSEVSARQTGTAAQAPVPAKLHRPSDPPQRRSGPGRDPAAAPPSRPSITFAPANGPVAAGPHAVATSAAAPAMPARPAAAAHVTHYETQRPHAITQITDLPPESPPAASPRALLWIMAAVVGAGVILLVLSLLSGPKPVPARAQPPTADPSSEPAMDVETLSADSGEDAGATPANGDQAGATTPAPEAIVPGSAAATEPAAGGANAPLNVASPFAAPAPVPAPATKPREERRVERLAPPPEGPMSIQITTVWSSWVEASCDGRTLIDRQMRPGESESLECDTVLRVSATDAGAVRLRVNDAPCLPLGDPGARAYGYTIRIDDFQRICRPEQGDEHGRR